MEFIGHSPTACYFSAPRRPEVSSKLPCTTKLPKLAHVPAFRCPPPYPHKRSLSTVGFRPATYYSAAMANPGYPLSQSQVDSSAPGTDLSELCGIKVPSVYSASRNALYTRYTPRDWTENYQRLLQANDRGQKDGECLRHDSDRLIDHANEQAKANQAESIRKLGDRIADMVFWENEMTDEIDNMVAENNELNHAKRVAEKMLGEVENQMHVAQENLYQREKRQGIDLVHDDVEKALLDEVQTVQNVQTQLKDLIDKANAQIELNRAAQHELEVDLKNKFTAQQIDETAAKMKNTSAGVHYYEGVENIDQSQSVPETWNKNAQDIVNRSRAERNAAQKLRTKMGTAMGAMADELSRRWSAVTSALARRIREVTDARNQIQASLGRTIQEISDTEREIEKLKAAIRTEEDYLKTATSRLNIRLRRPGIEHVADAADMQLKCEVAKLKDRIAQLRAQLCRAQDQLQELLRLRSAKEAELAIKNNSLFIDRERCMGLRRTWPGGPLESASHGFICPCVPGHTTDAGRKVCMCRL